MGGFFKDAFGSGTSALGRGVVGLIVAPSLAFLVLVVPLFAVLISTDLMNRALDASQVRAGFMVLALGYVIFLSTTAVIGAVIWAALRISKRESGRMYAVVGAVGGVLAGFRLGHGSLYSLAAGNLLQILLCAACGALIALMFWLIARRPQAGGAVATKST